MWKLSARVPAGSHKTDQGRSDAPFFSSREQSAPTRAMAAQSMKAYVKVPVASLMLPPTKGPNIWAVAKISVITPRAAGKLPTDCVAGSSRHKHGH